MEKFPGEFKGFTPENCKHENEPASRESLGEMHVSIVDEPNWIVGQLAGGYVNFLAAGKEIYITIAFHEAAKSELLLDRHEVVSEGMVGLDRENEFLINFTKHTSDKLERKITAEIKKALVPFAEKARTKREEEKKLQLNNQYNK